MRKSWLAAGLTLLVSTFLVCMLIHLIPGDPVLMMMAQNSSPSPEQIAAMRRWCTTQVLCGVLTGRELVV